MTAWLLTFYLFGALVAVPGIASEQGCHDLAAELSKSYGGVNAAYVQDGKCTSYQMAVWRP